MLISKRSRRPVSRIDWFNPAYRTHFDTTLSRSMAESLVRDVAVVASHAFLPLLTFDKVERRFRTSPTGKPRAKLKRRPLAYASNKDGYIYSYYSTLLSDAYERYVSNRGLDRAIVGYRRGFTNISVAKEAFDEIEQAGKCTALAFDIKSFFDNIDHGVLKRHWLAVLDIPTLPADHFNVFKALTRCRLLNLDDCLTRLGLDFAATFELLPKPLCSSADFRDFICGGDRNFPSLIGAIRDTGIPQGTPISPVAANIAMMSFDEAMTKLVTACNGSYRRYSDDILIICPTLKAAFFEAETLENLKLHTKSLSLSVDKTLRVDFLGRHLRVKGKPLQYLGFTFDGVQRAVRPGTLGRYYSRMARAAAWAKLQRINAKEGVVGGRLTIHKRELNARFTHIGKNTFITGYGRRAAVGIGGSAIIKGQFAGHTRRLAKSLLYKP